jgi:DnaJ like chaperone protein
MAKFGKWIGGGLGFTLGGPLGALAGFFLGAFLDDADELFSHNLPVSEQVMPTRGDYLFSLLVLITAVLKADGKYLKSELNYVKEFLRQNFGEEGAHQALKVLHSLKDQEINETEICFQIKQFMDHHYRLQLLHFLFGIAAADGTIAPEELDCILNISRTLDISETDHQSIEAMFLPKTDWAYQILEVSPNAAPEEIKKAYRKMAVMYHPDKVSYLGPEIQQAANEKFQKVNEAYQVICKEKNIH